MLKSQAENPNEGIKGKNAPPFRGLKELEEYFRSTLCKVLLGIGIGAVGTIPINCAHDRDKKLAHIDCIKEVRLEGLDNTLSELEAALKIANNTPEIERTDAWVASFLSNKILRPISVCIDTLERERGEDKKNFSYGQASILADKMSDMLTALTKFIYQLPESRFESSIGHLMNEHNGIATNFKRLGKKHEALSVLRDCLPHLERFSIEEVRRRGKEYTLEEMYNEDFSCEFPEILANARTIRLLRDRIRELEIAVNFPSHPSTQDGGLAKIQ